MYAIYTIVRIIQQFFHLLMFNFHSFPCILTIQTILQKKVCFAQMPILILRLLTHLTAMFHHCSWKRIFRYHSSYASILWSSEVCGTTSAIRRCLASKNAIASFTVRTIKNLSCLLSCSTPICCSQRPNQFNTILRSGHLFQQYVVD